MPLEYEKQTLDNGLDVIVHIDRACPIIAVNLWYHVGSKNEQPGRTGFAHLFEHLMFEGSKHHDRGYFSSAPGGGRRSPTGPPMLTGRTTGRLYRAARSTEPFGWNLTGWDSCCPR